MDWIANQKYLKSEQYQKSDRLEARMYVHENFSTNPCRWPLWVFDQLTLHDQMKILELGSGPGTLWEANLQRIPDQIQIFLSDLSLGMMQTSKLALHSFPQFSYLVVDTQKISSPGATFDLVIANHMLYHVPDIHQGLLEMSRVLAPEGYLVAATNGEKHMIELYQLIREVEPDFAPSGAAAARFGLENGEEMLRKVFRRVERVDYKDSLWITETQPLMDYINSMWGHYNWQKSSKDHLRRLVDERIRDQGGYAISKSTGIFICGVD
jgi:ubiquinone/menaquinone biosynthesis C-methylase UbiE